MSTTTAPPGRTRAHPNRTILATETRLFAREPGAMSG